MLSPGGATDWCCGVSRSDWRYIFCRRSAACWFFSRCSWGSRGAPEARKIHSLVRQPAGGSEIVAEARDRRPFGHSLATVCHDGRRPSVTPGFRAQIDVEPRRGDRLIMLRREPQRLALHFLSPLRGLLVFLAVFLGLTPQAKYLPPLRGSGLTFREGGREYPNS